MEERLDIDTPEGVVFGYRVAGIGSRFMAALVDTVVLTLTLLAFFCGFGALAQVTSGLGMEGWVVALTIAFIFVLTWGYYIFFEMVWNGQSPGKRWAGLRVIRVEGTPITLVDSVIRNLVRVIDFLPLYYALGLIVMFFNDQARRLGDYAAGTLVVKEQRDVTLESVQKTLKGRGALSDVSDASTLSESDYRLITDFINRRHELENRDELAQRIATTFADKLGIPRPQSSREAIELLNRLTRRNRH